MNLSAGVPPAMQVDPRKLYLCLEKRDLQYSPQRQEKYPAFAGNSLAKFSVLDFFTAPSFFACEVSALPMWSYADGIVKFCAIAQSEVKFA